MPTKKQCEITTCDKTLRELTAPACKDWDKRDKQKTRLGAASVTVVDYVKLIPKYPTTPEDYARCIGKWMACHSLATTMNSRLAMEISTQQQIARVEAIQPQTPYTIQYLDYLRKQLATMQKQQAVDIGVLSALIAAYEGCMTGFPT